MNIEQAESSKTFATAITAAASKQQRKRKELWRSQGSPLHGEEGPTGKNEKKDDSAMEQDEDPDADLLCPDSPVVRQQLSIIQEETVGMMSERTESGTEKKRKPNPGRTEQKNAKQTGPRAQSESLPATVIDDASQDEVDEFIYGQGSNDDEVDEVEEIAPKNKNDAEAETDEIVSADEAKHAETSEATPLWEKAFILEEDDESEEESEDEDLKTKGNSQLEALMKLEKERDQEIKEATKAGIRLLNSRGRTRYYSMTLHMDKNCNLKHGNMSVVMKIRTGGPQSKKTMGEIFPSLAEKNALPNKIVNAPRPDGTNSYSVRLYFKKSKRGHIRCRITRRELERKEGCSSPLFFRFSENAVAYLEGCPAGLVVNIPIKRGITAVLDEIGQSLSPGIFEEACRIAKPLRDIKDGSGEPLSLPLVAMPIRTEKAVEVIKRMFFSEGEDMTAIKMWGKDRYARWWHPSKTTRTRGGRGARRGGGRRGRG